MMKQVTIEGRDVSARTHHTGFLVLQRTHQLLLLELSLLLTSQSFGVLRVDLLSTRGGAVHGGGRNCGLTDNRRGRGRRGSRIIWSGGNGFWGGNLSDDRRRGNSRGRGRNWLRLLRCRCLLLCFLCVLEVGGIDSKLNGLSCRPGSQVIHPGLQSLLPSIEVHARQLSVGWGLKVDVQALALADKCSTISGEVENLLLTDLPDGLVDRLDVVWNSRDALDRPVVSDDHVLHVLIPEAKVDELLKKPRANDLELPSEDAASVNIAS